MNVLVFLITITAGGIGAGLRYLADNSLRCRTRSTFPWGTTIINISGSFALGTLTGLAAAHLVQASWLTILGVGLIGGYTTFSTASVETVRLLLTRKPTAALFNGLAMLVACVGAAYLGLVVAS